MGNQQSAILVKDWLARWLDEKVRPARKVNTQERYEESSGGRSSPIWVTWSWRRSRPKR